MENNLRMTRQSLFYSSLIVNTSLFLESKNYGELRIEKADLMRFAELLVKLKKRMRRIIATHLAIKFYYHGNKLLAT